MGMRARRAIVLMGKKKTGMGRVLGEACDAHMFLKHTVNWLGLTLLFSLTLP